ncbi:MAG: hypothetical protein K6A23_11460 [Butyrivibrio sp.]|nr:hypothetical protein [Butyrivibrio sp.]
MQEDFHYYATYCAAYLAGFSHEESLDICYSAQLVDLCSRTFLSKVKGPLNAATTQLQLEMMDSRTDIIGLQDITRIWASFHFLPKDLHAMRDKKNKRYMNKYRLICGPNGSLMVKTVKLARGKSLQHIGIAMHVLADTWAHMYFAGTPSLVINNTNDHFYAFNDEKNDWEKIKFNHNPASPDNIEKSYYTNSLYQNSENSIMNLGHGRAGHLPDYSFIKYKYLPAWGNYQEIIKDNPSDYYKAFGQMVYAMKYLRGEEEIFVRDKYETNALVGYEDKINEILRKKQLLACDDWKKFGEELSGKAIEDFDVEKYQNEYINANEQEKISTFLGKFFIGALEQKGMVTNSIYRSGNILAGFSVRLFVKGGLV